MARVKLQEEIWTAELGVSCCVFVLIIMGIGIGMGGLGQLPLCTWSNPSCYFFVKVSLMSLTAYTCCNSSFLFGGSNRASQPAGVPRPVASPKLTGVQVDPQVTGVGG